MTSVLPDEDCQRVVETSCTKRFSLVKSPKHPSYQEGSFCSQYFNWL